MPGHSGAAEGGEGRGRRYKAEGEGAEGESDNSLVFHRVERTRGVEETAPGSQQLHRRSQQPLLVP